MIQNAVGRLVYVGRCVAQNAGLIIPRITTSARSSVTHSPNSARNVRRRTLPHPTSAENAALHSLAKWVHRHNEGRSPHDGIYAFRSRSLPDSPKSFTGLPVVRRIQYRLDGTMVVRCDNPSYPEKSTDRTIRIGLTRSDAWCGVAAGFEPNPQPQ
jgi:hypothetical protein